MNVLVKLLIALVIGAVVAWVAGLVLPETIALLIGIAAGAVYFFSYGNKV